LSNLQFLGFGQVAQIIQSVFVNSGVAGQRIKEAKERGISPENDTPRFLSSVAFN
jgi:hypothetical protein